MWIDPLEVSYRIGENGSICVLYEHKANKKDTTTPEQPEAWRPTTSNSTSSTATVVVSNASGMLPLIMTNIIFSNDIIIMTIIILVLYITL